MSTQSSNLKDLETTLGYFFSDQSLLLEALTHPSLSFENKNLNTHYERLEFLGDAILSAIIGHIVFEEYPDKREGVLANMRSILSSGATLALAAQSIQLNQYIKMSHLEHAQQGQLRPKVLEDALEAIIGAIYLDSHSFDITFKIVSKLYGNIKEQIALSVSKHNPKGKLQEWYQEHCNEKQLEYKLVGTKGPAHQKKFFIELWTGSELLGSGEGFSKKEAEENAAKEAITKLNLNS